MKIDMHPSLYLKYKDKRIRFYGIPGTIVGYFITEKNNPILVLEIDNTARNFKLDNIKDWTKNNSFILKDYHGDIGNKFYFINQRDFDKGFAVEINI